jgi:hypothetical protein
MVPSVGAPPNLTFPPVTTRVEVPTEKEEPGMVTAPLPKIPIAVTGVPLALITMFKAAAALS